MESQRELDGDRAAINDPAAGRDAPRLDPRYPGVVSFRSRRGSLTGNALSTWDAWWPTLGAEVSDAWAGRTVDSDGRPVPTRHTPEGFLDTDAWFGRAAPLILEIGCGTGTATAAMAAAEPEVNLLAVDVYRPGLAQLLAAVSGPGNPNNVRLLKGDAVEVLRELLPPASLTAIRVFFPDPWPKKRHHKRRLLQAATMALASSRLVPGGIIHVATDHADYAAHIGPVGDAESSLRRLAGPAPVSLARPVTKFEGKAHLVGSAINEFVWERTSS